MDAVVQLDDVTVIYGKNQALKNVSREIRQGAPSGLLGPNGAGKSTMLKSLLGFVKPDQGQMTVLDMDVAAARRWRSARASATCPRATRTFPA